MTTGKTIALSRQTFVGKVMSLLFNMLSKFVIALLLRRKCLLILWLQSASAVILKSKKVKSVTVSIVSPSICHGVVGLDAMILVFWMLRFWVSSPFFSLLCISCLSVLLCRPPGSSVHGILKARILEWVAFPFSSMYLCGLNNCQLRVFKKKYKSRRYY